MKQLSIKISKEEFPNNKIDHARFKNQVNGLFKSMEITQFGQDVQITKSTLFTQEELDKIDELVLAHTGEPLDFLSKSSSDDKRLKVQEIVAMAVDRADLQSFVPAIRSYLNFRNKELDGHLYYGATDHLVASIMADKEVGEPYEALLNAEVTAPDAENPNGVKAWEFFVGKITGVI